MELSHYLAEHKVHMYTGYVKSIHGDRFSFRLEGSRDRGSDVPQTLEFDAFVKRADPLILIGDEGGFDITPVEFYSQQGVLVYGERHQRGNKELGLLEKYAQDQGAEFAVGKFKQLFGQYSITIPNRPNLQGMVSDLLSPVHHRKSHVVCVYQDSEFPTEVFYGYGGRRILSKSF